LPRADGSGIATVALFQIARDDWLVARTIVS